ncbi:flagellar biosynthetic protein FliR [Ferrigenium sp. UT5]|uniref:flagellar biosynthetic protein FliR n=1 Tax=Ferrigenium sp. UT5 TaxID=3242105 RepID=UPI00355173F9
MISFTSTQLTAWLATLIYPLARILALIASSPLLGNRQVPARVKIGLAFVLTLVIAPTLPAAPLPDPASARGLFVLGQQIVAGLMMGFSIRLIFSAIEMAGDIAGMQMGLGFANFFDPTNATFTPIIAQFLGILVALSFVALDLHLTMLAALADSFQAFPIGDSPLAAGAFLTVAEWGGSLFAFALQLSLPLIAALLATNLALGILTRSAPQLNIFAVGFPITLAVGFGALALVVPYIAPLLNHAFQQALETVGRFMLQLGGF